MRRRLATGVTIVGALWASGCWTTHTTRRLGEESQLDCKAGGVVYSIPRSSVTVDVVITRKDTAPGPLKAFAPLYSAELGYPLPSDVTHKKSKSYSVKSVSVGAEGVFDPEHIYVAEFNDGVFSDSEVTVALDQAGMITSFKSSSQDRTLEFAIKTIEVAAKVAGATFGTAGKASAVQPKSTTVTLVPPSSKPNPPPSEQGLAAELTENEEAFKARRAAQTATYYSVPLSQIDREATRKLLWESHLIRDWAYRLSLPSRPGPLSVDESTWRELRQDGIAEVLSSLKSIYAPVRGAILAEHTAKALRRVRDQLDSYLPKNVPSETPDALARKIKAFKDREAEYVAAFLGSSKKTDFAIRLSYTPPSKVSDQGVSVVLLEFSRTEGVWRAGQSLGVPLSKKLAASTKPDDSTPLTLGISLTEGGRSTHALITSAIPDLTGSPERGFFYRVPVAATATVTMERDPLARRVLPIGQFGRVAWLPECVWGTSSTYSLTVHPETGGLKSATLSSKGASADALEPLGGAAESLADGINTYRSAKAARESAREERNDSLRRATREADLLEQELRRRQLEAELSSQD